VSGLTYNWTVPAGATINSGQGTNAINANWGTTAGNVSVTASNSCGISVARNLAVALASCMQGNQDDEGLTEAAIDGSDLWIYPNPNDGNFKIRSSKAGTFQLMSTTGQLVRVFQLNESNGYSFDVIGLSTGFYLLQGLSGSDYIQSKIIVSNQ
jgi:hypothetical protein